jgi:hypothetical protein
LRSLGQFHPRGVEALADRHRHVITASRQVIQDEGFARLLIHRGLIDLYVLLGVVISENPNRALSVVVVRDRVYQDFAQTLQGLHLVIHIDEVRNLTLILTGKDGATAGFVGLLAYRGVKHP